MRRPRTVIAGAKACTKKDQRKPRGNSGEQAGEASHTAIIINSTHDGDRNNPG
jgi:hypothetical protein